MHKTFSLLSVVFSLSLALPAMAQNAGPMPQTFMPGLGSGGLPSVGGILQGILNPNGNSGLRNGLAPTSMDSFVYEAQGRADMIYGDEGDVGLPPFDEFTKDHRINYGILGRRAAGLTTGHGSYLPDAWGGDEWVDGPEFDQSGAQSGPQQPPPFSFNLPGGLGQVGVGPGGVGVTGLPGGGNIGIGQTGVTGGAQLPGGGGGISVGGRGGVQVGPGF